MSFRVLVVDDNEIFRETLTEYLGKQSGIEVARIIKECYPAKRIVFVTFHDEELYREQAQSIDVDGFVCKECLGRNLPSLLKRLRQATQR